MKKIWIFIFFVIKTLSSQAQTSIYHPFPDSGAVWNQTLGWFDGTCDGTENSSIFFGVDTTIGSHVYHKLKKSGFEYSTTCGGGGYFYFDSIALIRQDIPSKKVYFYDAGIDTILYDFDLHVGDTLNTSKVHWGNNVAGTVIVTSMDSVLIFGNYRKRFNFNKFGGWIDFNGCTDTSIIEGIGSNAGVLSTPSDCFESFAQLTCFSQTNDTNAMCINISDINEPGRNDTPMLFFPNPVESSVTMVCNSTLRNAELIIIDSYGRILFKRNVYGSTTTIDFDSLSGGIYFYQFINDSRKVAQGKLIVK